MKQYLLSCCGRVRAVYFCLGLSWSLVGSELRGGGRTSQLGKWQTENQAFFFFLKVVLKRKLFKDKTTPVFFFSFIKQLF